ncbi:MAG: DUF4160 domain-containing protein [Panacagrimonas sp.]
MPTLHRGASWKLAVYGRDHGVPHFHLECADGSRCSVAIDSLEVLVGAVKASILAEARVWAVTHRSLLHRTWKECNP